MLTTQPAWNISFLQPEHIEMENVKITIIDTKEDARRSLSRGYRQYQHIACFYGELEYFLFLQDAKTNAINTADVSGISFDQKSNSTAISWWNNSITATQLSAPFSPIKNQWQSLNSKIFKYIFQLGLTLQCPILYLSKQFQGEIWSSRLEIAFQIWRIFFYLKSSI